MKRPRCSASRQVAGSVAATRVAPRPASVLDVRKLAASAVCYRELLVQRMAG